MTRETETVIVSIFHVDDETFCRKVDLSTAMLIPLFREFGDDAREYYLPTMFLKESFDESLLYFKSGCIVTRDVKEEGLERLCRLYQSVDAVGGNVDSIAMEITKVLLKKKGIRVPFGFTVSECLKILHMKSEGVMDHEFLETFEKKHVPTLGPFLPLHLRFKLICSSTFHF